VHVFAIDFAEAVDVEFQGGSFCFAGKMRTWKMMARVKIPAKLQEVRLFFESGKSVFLTVPRAGTAFLLSAEINYSLPSWNEYSGAAISLQKIFSFRCDGNEKTFCTALTGIRFVRKI